MLPNKKLEITDPGDQSNRQFGGGGHYLEVARTGDKWRRPKYIFIGKCNRSVLGVYPDVGLIEAREGGNTPKQLPERGMSRGSRARRKRPRDRRKVGGKVRINRSGFHRPGWCCGNLESSHRGALEFGRSARRQRLTGQIDSLRKPCP